MKWQITGIIFMGGIVHFAIAQMQTDTSLHLNTKELLKHLNAYD